MTSQITRSPHPGVDRAWFLRCAGPRDLSTVVISRTHNGASDDVGAEPIVDNTPATVSSLPSTGGVTTG